MNLKILLLAAVFLIPTAAANTECLPPLPGECTITIMINIAFSYNESEISQNQIDAWAKDIEDTWNGENGYQTYGECECKVKFQVNTIKVTDPKYANCKPPPPGYHCIAVTDFNKSPPKNENGTRKYRGYMYNISQHGGDVSGWWSNSMNAPSPSGEPSSDAAHEAGHMMGLDDDYDRDHDPPQWAGNNIMGKTGGKDAKPTQDQINKAVDNVCKDVCGDQCCPDSCCCGNGKKEDWETCDPMMDPTGCGENAYCCKICCECHMQACDPELGQYATQGDCKQQCKDGDCYYNYKNGCWDCVERQITVHELQKTSVPQAPFGIAGIVIALTGLLFIGGGAIRKDRTFMIIGTAVSIAGLTLVIVMPALGPSAPSVAGPANMTAGVTPLAEMSVNPEAAKNPKEWVLYLRENVSGEENETIVPIEGPGELAVTCGDRVCSVTENCSSCAQDCGTCRYCGDRSCSVTENCSTCQADCGRCPYCGDGKCLGGETCSSCSRDCGSCAPVCGNRRCESGETCSSCKKDCGECPEVCGDGDCEGDEDCESCEEDCGACGPECGNDKCEAGEDCECSDCECPPGLYCSPTFPDADPVGCSHFGGVTCGNGLCDETEYCYTCPIDCKCGPETCCSPANPGIGCGICE